jgi:hypothetical protein
MTLESRQQHSIHEIHTQTRAHECVQAGGCASPVYVGAHTRTHTHTHTVKPFVLILEGVKCSYSIDAL